MTQREFTVRVHREDGILWAQVLEEPGVFATGDTIDELQEALEEALNLALGTDEAHAEWQDGPINQEETRRLLVCG